MSMTLDVSDQNFLEDKIMNDEIKNGELDKFIVDESFTDTVKKKWYESKTVIFNMFIAIFAGVGSLLADASFQEMMGEFFSYILTVVTVVNVYLRTITSEALEKIRGN